MYYKDTIITPVTKPGLIRAKTKSNKIIRNKFFSGSDDVLSFFFFLYLLSSYFSKNVLALCKWGQMPAPLLQNLLSLNPRHTCTLTCFSEFWFPNSNFPGEDPICPTWIRCSPCSNRPWAVGQGEDGRQNGVVYSPDESRQDITGGVG